MHIDNVEKRFTYTVLITGKEQQKLESRFQDRLPSQGKPRRSACTQVGEIEGCCLLPFIGVTVGCHDRVFHGAPRNGAQVLR